MPRINFSLMPKETKEKMLRDISGNMVMPCSIEGIECPLGDKYEYDCDRDNDNHCIVIDFMSKCVYAK